MYTAPGGVGGGHGGEGVLHDAVARGIRRHQPAVREDARASRALEPGGSRAGGSRGGRVVGAGSLVAACAETSERRLIPLSASVNSLGMIQSLLDALSAILGSVCRYWYASSFSSGSPSGSR